MRPKSCEVIWPLAQALAKEHAGGQALQFPLPCCRRIIKRMQAERVCILLILILLFENTIRYDTIVAWCTLKYKIKNRPVAYYRVSKSYVVLGNARVKKQVNRKYRQITFFRRVRIACIDSAVIAIAYLSLCLSVKSLSGYSQGITPARALK